MRLQVQTIVSLLHREECEARAEIMFDFYSGTVEMEALCMIDMIVTQIIPAVKQAGVGSVSDLQGAADAVKVLWCWVSGSHVG